MPGLEYLCQTYGIEPSTATVRMSPSARAESYTFTDIDERQKTSRRWSEFLSQDEAGSWHVDFHQRTVADLTDFGIKPENMRISEGDTAHPESPYFSYSQSVKGIKADGGNGLFFALRS
jgi:copper oxidase (laccase) domain-containing protein